MINDKFTFIIGSKLATVFIKPKHNLQTLNLNKITFISQLYPKITNKQNMGNQSQSPTNNQQILHQYTLIKQLSQFRNLYKHNTTKKQFISIERTFPNQQAIREYEKSMQKLLQIKHPYFLNETQHTMTAASMLCSVQYRVVHFFQHQPHTLEYELSNRKIHERYFEEKQIWSILCSSVLAMAHLTKNDISFYTLHPKDITIDKSGMIKILSPLLTDQISHQMIDPTLYYSPQHLKAIKTQSFSQLSNKSCVFTLGITLLHIMSLEPMNELYNYENCTVNMELLNQLIEKIAHTEIKEVIKKMVKFHGYDRITFTELEEMLYDVLEGDEANEDAEHYHANHDENGHSKLENSIHKLNQSGVYTDINQDKNKQSHTISYQTGPSSYRENNKSTENLSTENKLKPIMNDSQDNPSFTVYESGIDVQNVDEQDANIQKNQGKLQQQQKYQKNKLPQSQYTNGTASMANSNLNQTTDNKTLRKALHQVNSFHNVTLGKPLTHPQKSPNSITISNLHSHQSDPTRPHHVRQQLKRGVYQGYKLNNVRHGYGVFYYADGGKYAGEWVKNKMEGRGALHYANQQIAYEGEWLNDKLHGYGVLYNELPTQVSNPFDFRTLHLVDDMWVKYEGNFYEDEKSGQGTLFLSNGEFFRGNFSKDLPHGKGIYKCLNGNIIKGNWILGMIQ